jgi:hypothetical protein
VHERGAPARFSCHFPWIVDSRRVINHSLRNGGPCLSMERCLLLLCATSQPLLTQSAKLTRTVHSRVDLPTQLRLYLSQRRNHIGETYLTRDHIARRLFLASCNRPVHERKANPILKRTERFVKNVSYSTS